MAIEFPQIDPVALTLGPVQIRWYALAYLAGILLGLTYIKRILLRENDPLCHPTRNDVDDFMNWAIIGIILGGRVGYCLFYNASFYLENPTHIIRVWEGGMSFHGGFLGVVVSTILFSLKRKIDMLRLADLLACAAPIGLFFGRLSNFINGELYGRTTDVSWGVIFPHAGGLPRHPSQLYEATLEGIALFLILFMCSRIQKVKENPGLLAVIFIVGYALSRMVIELFREPDAHIGFVVESITRGQILSGGMIDGAFILFVYVMKKSNVTT
jgi:phosphatidylglycerol:prolipoprotein diacylglycerol transferase